MIEIVSGEAPEPETIIFLDRPEWEERLRRAVILGRPFLIRGRDLNLADVEELAGDQTLRCKLVAPDQALIWME